MRILLDEDVPRRLKRELVGHDVATVVEMGRSGIKNGVLLRLAVAAEFEGFLTCDRNILQHQQNIPALGLALVVLAVPNKKLETLRLLVPEVLAVLDAHPQPGTLSMIGSWHV